MKLLPINNKLILLYSLIIILFVNDYTLNRYKMIILHRKNQ